MCAYTRAQNAIFIGTLGTVALYEALDKQIFSNAEVAGIPGRLIGCQYRVSTSEGHRAFCQSTVVSHGLKPHAILLEYAFILFVAGLEAGIWGDACPTWVIVGQKHNLQVLNMVNGCGAGTKEHEYLFSTIRRQYMSMLACRCVDAKLSFNTGIPNLERAFSVSLSVVQCSKETDCELLLGLRGQYLPERDLHAVLFRTASVMTIYHTETGAIQGSISQDGLFSFGYVPRESCNTSVTATASASTSDGGDNTICDSCDSLRPSMSAQARWYTVCPEHDLLEILSRLQH